MIPKEKQLLIQLVRGLQAQVIAKPDGAERLTETILYLWQIERFPLLVKEGPLPNKDYVVNLEVQRFATCIAACEFFDGAFWLSSAYAIWVGNDIRAARSLYFTPPQLANRLIDDLLRNGASLTRHVWLDPACGGGAFLAPVAKRMAEALRMEGKTENDIVTHIAQHLLGNDLDPVLARLSTQFLRMAIYQEIVSAKKEPSFFVTVDDGLKGSTLWLEKVDVIICNPPYRKLKKIEVAPYLKVFSDVSQGQPNIYAMFFQQALRLLRKDGLAGLLTPTSFLSGQDFAKLRTFLLKTAKICQLDIVRAREGIFVGVSQETAISILKRKLSSETANTEPEVFVFDHIKGFKNIGHCHLPNSGMAWPVPRQQGDADIIRALPRKRYHLKDYGYTARIGTFVDYRDTRPTYMSEKEGAKAAALFPLLRSRDITSEGKLEHGRARNGFVHTKFIDMGNSSHISVIRRPCIALQRVTSTDQLRRLVSAPVDAELMKKFGGVVGENHVVFIEMIDKNAALTPSQLGKVLRSEPIDKLFRCISGAVNVSIFELNQLPLPCPKILRDTLKATSNVDDAVRKAFTIHSGK